MSEDLKINEAVNNQVGFVGFEDIVVTSDKKFKPRPEFNNLCQARLVSVEIKYTTTPNVDDKGIARTYEYRGIPVPTLCFRYAEEPTPDDATPRFYSDSYRIVVTKDDNGADVGIKLFKGILESTYRHMRHRLEVYAKCPNFVEPGLPNGINMYGTIDERVKQWTAFCEFFVKAFNEGKDGKPIFVDERGESILLWMKVLAHHPDRKYLCAPKYVGQGYLEIVSGKKPSIEILNGETIELTKEVDTPKVGAAAESGSTMGYGNGSGAMGANAIADLQSKYAGTAPNTNKY